MERAGIQSGRVDVKDAAASLSPVGGSTEVVRAAGTEVARVSWRSRFVGLALRFLFKSRVAGKDFVAARVRMANILETWARRLRPPSCVERRATTVGGVSCEWIWAGGCAEAAGAIVYCHGGAFVAGSARTHLDIAWRLSAATSRRVLLVNYRLAPLHTFPAPVEDVVAVYGALLREGVPSGRIALGGDSAGANLALAAMMRLRDEGSPLPGACLCLSPWVDLTLSGGSVESNAAHEVLLPVDLLRNAARVYAAGRDPAEPGLSPLFGDFSGFPPLWICAGDTEVLLDDATRLAQRAQQCGVAVFLRIWPGQPHAFPTLACCIREGRAAIDEIARFLAVTVPNARPSDTG